MLGTQERRGSASGGSSAEPQPLRIYGARSPGGPKARDSWMTDLPAERRAPAQMSQTSVTRFNQMGVTERGDTRDWTETPAQKQLRPLLRLTLLNRTHRKKSLLEQHQHNLKMKERAKKKARKAEGVPQGEKQEWEGVHPWRPFDREKDLLAGPPCPSGKEDMMKKAGNLAGRFSSGSSGPRSFL
eukprot:jgi/Botrbrau1/9823/Bobra.0313s0002.1